MIVRVTLIVTATLAPSRSNKLPSQLPLQMTIALIRGPFQR
jgi:hypothetical protein